MSLNKIIKKLILLIGMILLLNEVSGQTMEKGYWDWLMNQKPILNLESCNNNNNKVNIQWNRPALIKDIQTDEDAEPEVVWENTIKETRRYELGNWVTYNLLWGYEIGIVCYVKINKKHKDKIKR